VLLLVVAFAAVVASGCEHLSHQLESISSTGLEARWTEQ